MEKLIVCPGHKLGDQSLILRTHIKVKEGCPLTSTNALWHALQAHIITVNILYLKKKCSIMCVTVLVAMESLKKSYNSQFKKENKNYLIVDV